MAATRSRPRRRSRRPRQRRGGLRIRPVLVVLSVAAALIVADLLHVFPVRGAQPASAPPTTQMTTSTPATVVAGVIVDPSGSNGGTDTAHQTLTLLSNVVASWPGSKPTTAGGTPAVPALDLTVRQVALNSYAAYAQVAHVQIPAVPPVPPRPAQAGDLQANEAFFTTEAAAERAWTAARSAAASAAAALRSAAPRDEASEIAGALSALSQVMPTSDNGPRRIVVVSDLEQAGAAPQVAGTLRNTLITVFQRCDNGASRCTRARQAFTALSHQLGGPTPTYLRVETLAADLAAALKGA